MTTAQKLFITLSELNNHSNEEEESKKEVINPDVDEFNWDDEEW